MIREVKKRCKKVKDLSCSLKILETTWKTNANIKDLKNLEL